MIQSDAKPDQRERFDYVVIGSGGGAMCAALVMRSLGKSVLILEKTEYVGGSTARSGGVMWIPNNRFMREDGVPDSDEQALTYLNAVIGEAADAPGATAARRSAYVAEGRQMIDFLVESGVKLGRIKYWPDYYDELPGGSEAGRTIVADLFNVNELGPWKDRLRPGFMPIQADMMEALELPDIGRSWSARRALARMLGRMAWGALTGKHWVTAGAALQGRMLQAALKAGVEIRTETAVEQIIVEDDRVAGVIANQNGARRRIDAAAGVLINAGGFARNQEMRDKYIPATSTEWSNANPGDTGEMILEAERIGAELAQMEERVGTQMAIPPGDHEIKPLVQTDIAKPHAILVDQTGVRYMNEAGSYMEFVKGMLVRNKTSAAIPSWMILDSQYLRKFMLAGSMPGLKKPQAWYDSGFLHQGDTIEDLARACAMEQQVLSETIERFNAFAKKGRDEDFRRGDRAYDRFLGDALDKKSPSLGAIEKPPFFAVPIHPGDVGTFGGVVTDEYARVLRKDGSVIAGLYATGNSTASVMGRKYPGAGASIGPSFTWGFVAAKHAARAQNWMT